jgi:hypothetical protein
MLKYILAILFSLTLCSENIHKNISSEKNIFFSGLKWELRNTNSTQGPGPNYFSEQSAWVDEKGFLHLYLHKDSATGHWLCPEITSEKKFGYGVYTFTLEGAIDKFDKNIVLGLFNYSGNDGYDEIDIEFGRWGNSKYPNLNYTVWPAEKGFTNNSYTKEYLQKNNYSIQQFTWRKNSVSFSTFDADKMDSTNLVAANTCTQPPASISSLEMPVHINLWLFDGNPPEDNKPVEIVIRSFSFQQ